MKSLWYWLTKRCTLCGQKLASKQTVAERLAEINDRGTRLAERLGYPPRVQNCKECNRIVFEGEQGFVQSFLLIDMELGKYSKKRVAI